MKTILVKVIFCLLTLVAIADYIFSPGIDGDLHPFYELGIGVQYGFISFVYVAILIQPGHILAFWSDWVRKKYHDFHVKQWLKATKANQPYDLPEMESNHSWILKPIIDCAYCNAGELAAIGYYFALRGAGGTYTITGHLAAISVAILVSGVLSELWLLKIKK